MAYVKLFGSILDSTVWLEEPATKVVWITMLAMADRDGVVSSSVPGLAKRAGVELKQCETALEKFKSPDPHSRTKDNQGKRIVEVEGGWLLLNHAYYRAKMNTDERREYKARKQAEYRARKKQAGANALPGEGIAVAAMGRGDHATADKLAAERKPSKKVEAVNGGKVGQEIPTPAGNVATVVNRVMAGLPKGNISEPAESAANSVEESDEPPVEFDP